MEIQIPELSLVLLVGVAGSGKSSFASAHFRPTEILSSDFFRGRICNDETDQEATDDAFEVLHQIAGFRLKRGRLTLIDATNLTVAGRDQLRALARKYYVEPQIFLFDMPERLCLERNRRRNRVVSEKVIKHQLVQLAHSEKNLKAEGFRQIFRLTPDTIGQVEILRTPSPADRLHLEGPFDIIGDIHGCMQELLLLLARLGYQVQQKDGAFDLSHPEGRCPVFLGDLVDRGPDTPGVLRLVMDTVAREQALCVPGNHEIKLHKKLTGKEVVAAHGLQASIDQLATQPEGFSERVCQFIEGLTHHLVLDEGRLVVAHAGIKEPMILRDVPRVRAFTLWGDVSGETDSYGLPIRRNWAENYSGTPLIAYGHTPIQEAFWLNNTICLDTGCVFGGKLTALRYPERELVSVPAIKVWYQPIRPLQEPAVVAKIANGDS